MIASKAMRIQRILSRKWIHSTSFVAKGEQRSNLCFGATLQYSLQSYVRPFTTAVAVTEQQFTQLEQASRALLQKSSGTFTEAKELIQKWHALLSTLDTERLESAVERLQDLYQSLQGNDSNIDCASFRCLLQAYSRFQPNGPQALAILEAWNHVWMGDMERSPTLADYHSVLEAYAMASKDSTDIMLEGSQVALEALQRLDQWGFTMQPNLLSHSLAVCCISNVFFHVDNSQDLRSLHQAFQNKYVKRLLGALEDPTNDVAMNQETRHWATMALGSVIRYFAIMDGNGSVDNPHRMVYAGWMQQWISLSRDYWMQLNDDTEAGFYEQRIQRWKEHVDMTALSFFKQVEKASSLSDRLHDNRTVLSRILDDTLLLIEKINAKPLHTEHYYRAIKAAKRTRCVDENAVINWAERMRANHTALATDESIQPLEQTKAWNCLMMAYYELGNHDKVLRLWQDLNRSSHVRKDSISFAIILKSLAKQGTFKAAQKAHAIWKKMVSIDPAKRNIHPTSVHYAHVMSAWSNSRDPRAHTFCQDIMDHLLEESVHDPNLEPGLAHYTSLIGSHGWSRGDSESQRLLFKAINDLVKSGLTLDMQAYQACFAALTRTQSTDGATFAQQLLWQSIKQGLQPDARCFQAVLRAWAESKDPQAFNNCEKLIVELESSYLASGKQSSFRPNSHCYVSMITATMYTAGNCGPTAESILDRMINAAKENVADEPDKSVYSSVMKAYAHDGSAADVERIYQRMEKAFADGNYKAAPDSRSCAILLHAWARSEDPEKAFRTRQLLVDMFKAYESGNVDMMPNIQCYNATLNSCAFSDTKNEEQNTEIVRLALETIADMEKYYGEITEYAFRQIFHILGRFVADKADRLDLTATLFQKCCQAGYVSEHVMRIIKSRIPDFYSKLPGDKIARLPSQWTRRVVSQ